ncbi:MAG: tetratricopeptide repeat protein [Fimbriimonadales bacterium]
MASEELNTLINEAAEAVRQQSFEKGIDIARQAIELDSRSSDAYSVLGVALAKASRHDEATDAFQKAVQTGAYNARNYFNLAMHYYGLGKKNDAIAMCQEAIRCNGKHRGSMELLKKLETETHVEVAPYQTSLGDSRGNAYQYKKEDADEGPPPF